MAGDDRHYDALETRDPELRERALFAALPGQIEHAKTKAPGFARILDAVDAAAVVDRGSLARLPVTRKSDLFALQREAPPFGGLVAAAPGALARIFASPGPIYDPEARRQDFWRMARALFAAGFRRGDILHNCFSYHLTPAGAMIESGAHALGCAVIPGGTGQSEHQLRAIADLRPAGYVGTPSFLAILLDKAAESGAEIASLRKALVSGEAFPQRLRTRFDAAGIAALQCYATADLGLIAYESAARDGLILDEGVLLEIVRPGTGDPVSPGEVGEVVVTTLTPEYPLIRFATGDLSAVLPGRSPCGRTNHRIKGWMGRADQATKVRGMFVHPAQVAELVKRHKEIIRARLVVGRDAAGDVMTLKIEMGEPAEAIERIAETLQAVTKLRGTVERVAQGTLPNDGKVIEDARAPE
ncbi:MAG: AMP-binding protein [Alphaproteobacteria bacterium]|nr:AMP-binding protein [Alphaproteobacteria bacterium]